MERLYNIFRRCLLDVLATEQPQALAVAFDLALPTCRHEAEDTYSTSLCYEVHI